MSRTVSVVVADLLEQPVQVLVCEWYFGRPSWLPLRGSVYARDIRAEAGIEVYRELREEEPLAAGEAALTGAGRLRGCKGIVHVGSRSIWGGSSEAIIRTSARNAMNVVHSLGFVSVAFPVLGAGRGIPERKAYEALRNELLAIPSGIDVRIVRSPDRHG